VSEFLLMFENTWQFPYHSGVSFTLFKLFVHFVKRRHDGRLVDHTSDDTIVSVMYPLHIFASTVVTVVVSTLYLNFRIFFRSMISLDEFDEQAMVLSIDSIFQSFFDFLFAHVNAIEVSFLFLLLLVTNTTRRT